jgi:hypothetical protein
MINSDIKDVESLFDEFYFIDNINFTETKENEKKHKILLFETNLKSKLAFIYPNMTELTPVDRVMIDKLLNAGLKYTTDELLEIDHFQNRDFTLDEIINEIPVSAIVCWGVDKNSSHIISQFKNKKILFAKVLSEYHINKEAKIELWQQIQKII